MIYLDYSATTPIREEVLDTYVKVSKHYIGNSNSLHKLGIESRKLETSATKQIADLLGVKETEIIYTSGASESNNTVMKSMLSYQNRGKHILSTPFEHSSVIEPLKELEKQGFEIEMIALKKDGTVDLEAFQKQLRKDTVLVTLASVSSELGILQPIEEMGEILKGYPKCFFHVDMTQSIGKVDVSLKHVDFASCSSHKFYGPKGIGLLIKKEGKELTPLIHGGKSTTVYRSGTPATPLIASTAKALRLVLGEKKSLKELNHYLRTELEKIEGVFVNSPETAIPHILNFSVLGVKPETLLHGLEEHEIYISTQSACAKGDVSKPVFAFTKDENRARNSLRVSLSYLTTKEECEIFIQTLKEEIQKLRIK